MNEMLRTINRIRDLLDNGEREDVKIVLYTASEYAKAVEMLINGQNEAMSSQLLKIHELTDRQKYWENRARTHEKRLIELGELPEDYHA